MPSKDDYWRDPEKHRAKTRAYALAHPEWKRESGREWMRKKRALNRDVENARRREWRRARSPEQKAIDTAKYREWRQANPTYHREWERKNRGRDPLRSILNQAKARARKAGLPCDLTRQNLHVPDVCPVLGIALDYKAKGVFNPNSPSIDRIIPERGYVASNSRIISNRANILKRDGTLAEFRALVAYLERELD